MARSWGHTWQDFLALPIPMWWIEYEFHLQQQEQIEKSVNQPAGAGKFTEAEWQRAREEHKRKMKNGGN